MVVGIVFFRIVDLYQVHDPLVGHRNHAHVRLDRAKGKFADCAFAFDRQLNRVDLPTFGSPTIPHCKAIYIVFNNFDRVTKVQKYAIRRPTFSEELSPRRHPRNGNPADSAPSAAIFRKNHYFYILKNYFCTIPDKL